jgi:hypothetical protein
MTLENECVDVSERNVKQHTSLEIYNEFNKTQGEKIKSLNDELLAKTKEYLSVALKGYLATNPEVVTLGWPQYTPYFNDGDPCRFSAHVDSYSVYVNGYSGERYYDEEEDENKREIHDQQCEAVAAILRPINRHLFEQLFKEGLVEVSLNKNGEVLFKVQDYDHD